MRSQKFRIKVTFKKYTKGYAKPAGSVVCGFVSDSGNRNNFGIIPLHWGILYRVFIVYDLLNCTCCFLHFLLLSFKMFITLQGQEEAESDLVTKNVTTQKSIGRCRNIIRLQKSKVSLRLIVNIT